MPEEEELALALALSASLHQAAPPRTGPPTAPWTPPLASRPAPLQPPQLPPPTAPQRRPTPNLPEHPPPHQPRSPVPAQPRLRQPTQAPATTDPRPSGADLVRRLFGGCVSGGGGGRNGLGPGARRAGPSTASDGRDTSPPPPLPGQLYDGPNVCAACGRGFGLFFFSWVTGMGRKWHPGCFRCCVCAARIRGAYRWSGFWREIYCTAHEEARLLRCCACTRLCKWGEEWAPLPDGRPLCLQCLSSVVLDTPGAQPLYDEVLAFYAREMRLPHAYKPPLYLVEGAVLNQSALEDGRDDSPGAPVFHVRGLCRYRVTRHALSIIPALMSDFTGTLRALATELFNPDAARAEALRSEAPRTAHCHVRELLLLFGLPRLLCGSIMAHELMHAWLRMEGVVGLAAKVEEGLCQLMAGLWLDRQHELLRGKPEEQRLASFFSYQIRTDTSEVYGEGFREALEAFQLVGVLAVLHNVKLYGSFMPPRLP